MGEICAMTDEEILDEVYRRTVNIAKNGDANVPSQVRCTEFKEFIERKRITTTHERDDNKKKKGTPC